MTVLTRNHLLLLVLAAGWMNASIRPVAALVMDQGWGPAVMAGFGINPVIWIAMAAIIALIWGTADQPPSPMALVAGLVAGIGFLVPSSLICWLVLAGWCLVMWRCQGDIAIRAALTIALVMALRQPLTQSLLDILGEELLSFDAVLVSGLLQLIGWGAARMDNLVIGADGHQLLILTGCATYANLSLALLAWCVITSWRRAREARRVRLISLAILCLAIFSINICRLTLMGIDVDLYHFFHDGMGVQVFDAALTFATLTIAVLRGNHAHPVTINR